MVHDAVVGVTSIFDLTMIVAEFSGNDLTAGAVSILV